MPTNRIFAFTLNLPGTNGFQGSILPGDLAAKDGTRRIQTGPFSRFLRLVETDLIETDSNNRQSATDASTL